jgi:hypothetical protein
MAMTNKIQPKQIPSQMRLECNLELEAKAPADDSGLMSFRLNANTGTPMRPSRWDDMVVIDMEGATFQAAKTPILEDHLSSVRLGHSTEQVIVKAGAKGELGGKPVTGPLIAFRAVASGSGKEAKQFAKDFENGFPFQASVGADVLKSKYVPEGKETVVNGKTWKGPLVVAQKTSIYEVSVTTFGADKNTSVVAAGASPAVKFITCSEEPTMTLFEQWAAETGIELSAMSAEAVTKLEATWQKSQAPPVTPVEPSSEAHQQTVSDIVASRTLQAAESRRISAINRIAAKFGADTELTIQGKKVLVEDIAVSAIEAGDTADSFELLCRRSELPTATGPAIHVAASVRDMTGEVLSCALARTMGVPQKKTNEQGEVYGLEASYDAKVLEQASHRQLRNVSLHQLMDMVVIAATGSGYVGNRRDQGFIEATRQALVRLQAAGATTTMNLSSIFEDAASKTLLAAYQSVATTWDQWCDTVSVNDFKTANLYRFHNSGAYEPIGKDGTLKNTEFAENKYTVAADTYGKICGLTRQDIINDDLGAFSSLMASMGLMAARTIEEIVYVLLMNSLSTLFPSGGGNGNYLSGTANVLGFTGYTAATKLFRDMVDTQSMPLMMEPNAVLCGTADEIIAKQLYNDIEWMPQGGPTSGAARSPKRNQFAGTFPPIVSGYLNNTNIKRGVTAKGTAIGGQLSTHWIMLSKPRPGMGGLINVALLNGNRTPILEQADQGFNVLGVQYRAYHDVGAGLGDPKLAVYSTGA